MGLRVADLWPTSIQAERQVSCLASSRSRDESAGGGDEENPACENVVCSRGALAPGGARDAGCGGKEGRTPERVFTCSSPLADRVRVRSCPVTPGGAPGTAGCGKKPREPGSRGVGAADAECVKQAGRFRRAAAPHRVCDVTHGAAALASLSGAAARQWREAAATKARCGCLTRANRRAPPRCRAGREMRLAPARSPRTARQAREACSTIPYTSQSGPRGAGAKKNKSRLHSGASNPPKKSSSRTLFNTGPVHSERRTAPAPHRLRYTSSVARMWLTLKLSEWVPQLFAVNCTFEVAYELRPAGFVPSPEQLTSFSRGTAVFNCWPYAPKYCYPLDKHAITTGDADMMPEVEHYKNIVFGSGNSRQVLRRDPGGWRVEALTILLVGVDVREYAKAE